MRLITSGSYLNINRSFENKFENKLRGVSESFERAALFSLRIKPEARETNPSITFDWYDIGEKNIFI